MQKQIAYPTLITRMLAIFIDLSLAGVITQLFTNPIRHYIIFWIYKDFFNQNNLFEVNPAKMQILITNQELFTTTNPLLQIYTYLTLISLSIFMLFLYFFISQVFMHNTIGKMILKIKVVDAVSLQTPTKWQFICRFICYFTAPFGAVFMNFSKKKMTIHDKISGTLVIKC